MSDLSDEEYIELTGYCHKDIFEDDEHDCPDYMECGECPYWY